MRYFKKQKKGQQVYVILVEISDDGLKKETYLGNINKLSEDLLKEVEDYFLDQERIKSFKKDYNYEKLFTSSLEATSRKFGDMWLFYEIEKLVNLRNIVDALLIKRKRTRGANPGMFFVLAAFNRLLDPVSKNQMSSWLSKYDLKSIFEDEISAEMFTSDSYWHQWNAIRDDELALINNSFLKNSSQLVGSGSHKVALVDISNFSLYLSREINSEFTKKVEDKKLIDDLGNMYVSLLVDRDKEMILHYQIYQGKILDTQVFAKLLEEMVTQAKECGKDSIILVFDDGITSLGNLREIDKKDNLHFIALDSSLKQKDLMRVSLDQFEVVNCKQNRLIDEEIKKYPEEQSVLEKSKILAYTTSKEYAGKLRKVVVLYNGDKAQKEKAAFIQSLEKLQQWLEDAILKIEDKSIYYTNKESILKLYQNEAKKYHLSEQVFILEINNNQGLYLKYYQNKAFINDCILNLGK